MSANASEQELDEVSSCARYTSGTWRQSPAELPQEQTLALFVNGQELVSILCTPEKLNCLVIGFLRSEGLITSLKEIEMMRVCLDESLAEIRLTKQVALPERRTITSGCGGGVAFDQGAGLQPLNSAWRVTPEQILTSMRLMQSKSTGQTGNGRLRRGVHISGLSDGDKLITRAEDIGRHNTLDKILGECMLTGITTADRLLVTTGRISSEMLIKVARMGIPVVASLNSATQRAVQLGSDLGITIVGYARGEQFSVYTHPQRIVGFPSDAETGEARS